MDTISAENLLATSLASGSTPTPEEMEALIQCLLSEYAEHRPRSLDGVISIQERHSKVATEGTAIAITIDNQQVHPVAYSLCVGPNQELLENSYVTFGNTNETNAIYGSPQHTELANLLLRDSTSINWAFRFRRLQTGWVRDDV